MQAIKLTTVKFNNHDLAVSVNGDQQLVAMRPICEGIGLAWSGQRERIMRDEVLSSCVRVIRTQLSGDNQSREVLCLPIEYLNGWLFGIDVKRCREEIRPALIKYKRECYAALAAHWQQKPATPQLPEVQEELLNLRFEGRRFRVLRLPSGYWFVSAEVANALALSSRDIIQNHVPAAYRTKYKIGRQDCNIVSLEGLERAYLLADQTKAQALREFVQGVVALPHIEPVATPAQPAALPAPKRPLDIHFPLDYLAEQNVGRLTVRDGQRSWLDLTLQELREPFQSPCEIILYQLANAGFEVEAAWWELRTYRNKLESLLSAINSLNITVQEPARYATGDEG